MLLLIGIFRVGTVLSETAISGTRFDEYDQTVISRRNGLSCGEANDVAFTQDGTLWIGTYAGLYRFDGQNIRLINHYDTVHNVNTLFADDEGRLWIGTNDNGLSVMSDEKIIFTIDTSTGLSSNGVRAITRSSDGLYYISTTNGLDIFSMDDEPKLIGTFPELHYITDFSADNHGNVAAIAYGGSMSLLQKGQLVYSSEGTDIYYSSCLFDRDGSLLSATEDGRIMVYDVSNGSPEEKAEPLSAGGLYVNDMLRLDTGDLLLAAENGIGFLDAAGSFFPVDTGSFSFADHVTADKQGVLWFPSSRYGLLRMAPPGTPAEIGLQDGEINPEPDFRNLYAEAGMESDVINAITCWNDVFYFATDQGLRALDWNGQQVMNELTKRFQDTRIRCLLVDSNNHLWLGAFRHDLVEAAPDGSMYDHNESSSLLGNRQRVITELSDGTVAVGGYGIILIRDQEIITAISSPVQILSISELPDHRILAATDGDGILIIKNGKIVQTLTREDGIGSDVILRTASDPKGDGVFLVSSNGLYYMKPDQTVSPLKNFPYFNNYDIWIHGDRVYVMSSAGIYVVDYEELLSGNNEIHYQLLDYRQGLDSNLTSNSWQYYHESTGELLVCCSTGVYAFDPDHFSADIQVYQVPTDPASQPESNNTPFLHWLQQLKERCNQPGN